MLSFLKLVSTDQKWGPERFAVAPSAPHWKNHNIGAQVQSIKCIIAPKLFWKIYLLYDFWCAQTGSFRAVLDYLYEVWQLLSALYSVMQKKNYLQVHICVLGHKLLRWNFLQISQLNIRSGVHKLFPRFFDFSQFLTAISRKLWRHLATCMQTK